MRHIGGYLGIMAAFLLLGSPTRVKAAQPKIGDLMPEFSIPDDQGRIWNSRDHIGQRVQLYLTRPKVRRFQIAGN